MSKRYSVFIILSASYLHNFYRLKT